MAVTCPWLTEGNIHPQQFGEGMKVISSSIEKWQLILMVSLLGFSQCPVCIHVSKHRGLNFVSQKDIFKP